jgi:hypothetical protein
MTRQEQHNEAMKEGFDLKNNTPFKEIAKQCKRVDENYTRYSLFIYHIFGRN